MKFKVLIFIFTMHLVSCATNESKPGTVVSVTLPRAPKEVLLGEDFPGVMTVPQYADSIIRYVTNKYHISVDKMLLGVSTCVDDIIYTKNFRLHPEIKGPFNLGGLAGLPFTGISGLEAFAHHIPDDGVMFLIVTPHIGFSQSNGWGYVLRHEQHGVSTCCGALMGTLSKLEKGAIVEGLIREGDYQGDKIKQLALGHQKEILAANSHIIELTKITSCEAERLIRDNILAVDLEHVKYIMITAGVIINTDYAYSDYIWINHFMVYDVRKKAFVEELKN